MADEASRDLEQGFVVLSPFLCSNPDLSVAFEPSQGALDVPAGLSQSGAIWRSPFGQQGADAAPPEFFSVGL